MAAEHGRQDSWGFRMLPVSQYKASVQETELLGRIPKTEIEEGETLKVSVRTEPAESVSSGAKEEVGEAEEAEDYSSVVSPAEAYRKSKGVAFPTVFDSKLIKRKIQDEGASHLPWYHAHMLRTVLKECVSLAQWKDAAGVLAALLEASVSDTFHWRQRYKYWAAMEALRHLGDENENSYNRLYSLLQSKQILNKQATNKTLQPMINLEKAIYSANRRDFAGAHDSLKLVMQVRQCWSSPVMNLIHGLLFYQLWCNGVFKELHLNEESLSREKATKEESGMSDLDYFFDDVERDSEAFGCYPSVDKFTEDMTCHADGHTIGPDDMYDMSIINLPGLDGKLFPFQQRLQEGAKYMVTLESGNLLSLRLNALRHLGLAVSTSPPFVAALLPYLQLVLSKGDIKEAWKVVQYFCQLSEHCLPFSLRASLVEALHSRRWYLIAKCWEEALHKNPASLRAVKRLIKFHDKGYYPIERLVESLALYLEATDGIDFVWKALASGFCSIQRTLQTEQEMDCLSTDNEHSSGQNFIGISGNHVPEMLFKLLPRDTWKLRCRWWNRKHFCRRVLEAEEEIGNWKLIAFKVGCASHILGPRCGYVVSATSVLKRVAEYELLQLVQPLCQYPLNLFEHL